MSYNLLILKDVWIEIENAYDWYEGQKEGLGDDLLEEIEACYDRLIENPERYPHINDRYRRIRTNRFPYLVLYKIQGKTVIINRVRHIKQRPL